MNVLTLRREPKALWCGWYDDTVRPPRWQQNRARDGRARDQGDATAEEIRELRRALEGEALGELPDAVGIHLRHGGDVLEAPTRVTRAVLAALGEASAQAPLHIPPTVALAEACQQVLAGVPVWLVPETAFFSRLPERERVYGLDAETRRALGVRRYGYHGLFHAAACELVRAQRLRRGDRGVARIVSICLAPRPEVAAVRGDRAVMVTSGATPLEGLPGMTSCGELDAGIVLWLAQELGAGPEQLDLLLSRKSGLSALVGEALSLGELLRSSSRRTRLAREVFTYRLLLACGAGSGALGGVDALVFSGPHAADGQHLASELRSGLESALRQRSSPIDVWLLEDSLERLLADATLEAVARERPLGGANRGEMRRRTGRGPGPTSRREWDL